MNITAKTKICMTIGDPIQKSLSPSMHNAGFEALKIDDQYVFLACKVKSEKLESCFDGIRAMNIHFISVTMPHKQAVLKYLDEIDETAKKIGAVNTILNSSGKLTGYNTDWLGVVNSIEKVTSISGKNALVLGAGGAARAAVFGLTIKNAKVTVLNRTIEKAKNLANQFDCNFGDLSQIKLAKKMDIIVNVSSIGMYPDENKSLIPKDLISKNQVVLDAVYRPFETLLLIDAKNQGAKIIHGLEMFLHQGMAQFKMYTKHDAPEIEMRKVLLEKLIT